jgi:hypothetical protein
VIIISVLIEKDDIGECPGGIGESVGEPIEFYDPNVDVLPSSSSRLTGRSVTAFARGESDPVRKYQVLMQTACLLSWHIHLTKQFVPTRWETHGYFRYGSRNF